MKNTSKNILLVLRVTCTYPKVTILSHFEDITLFYKLSQQDTF